MQKDIIFYSNLCDFCKNVLNNLVKNDIKDKFMLVNVDNKNLKLPPFVDRVPLIYTKDKKIFADENLVNYIQSKITSSSLQPYALVGTNTCSYSENFSFISDNDDIIEDSSRNYNMVGMDTPIYLTPEETKKTNTNEDKVAPSMLEKYMADRDTDIKKIFGNSTNGFNRL